MQAWLKLRSTRNCIFNVIHHINNMSENQYEDRTMKRVLDVMVYGLFVCSSWLHSYWSVVDKDVDKVIKMSGQALERSAGPVWMKCSQFNTGEKFKGIFIICSFVYWNNINVAWNFLIAKMLSCKQFSDVYAINYCFQIILLQSTTLCRQWLATSTVSGGSFSHA